MNSTHFFARALHLGCLAHITHIFQIVTLLRHGTIEGARCCLVWVYGAEFLYVQKAPIVVLLVHSFQDLLNSLFITIVSETARDSRRRVINTEALATR